MTPRILGICLILLGIVLQKWAHHHLANAGIDTITKRFSTMKPIYYTHQGPYRVLRHPVYLGAMMVHAGTGLLAFGMWGGAVLIMPVLPMFFRRMVEENALRGVCKGV